jgi:phage-related minor tail protein
MTTRDYVFRLRGDNQQLVQAHETAARAAEHHAGATQGVVAAQANAQRVGEAYVASMARQRTGATAFGQAGKLTAQQLQQVSFQLNDLAVQVASGGNPLVALVQQGSQLSGTFGGVRPALAAVTSLITPAVVGFGGLAAAVGTVALAAVEGQRDLVRFDNTLAATGNRAGLTRVAYESIADSVARSTNTTIGSARELTLSLAATGQIGPRALRATAEAGQLMVDRLGKGTKEVVDQLVRLQTEPSKLALEWSRATNGLTVAQFKQVQALEKLGEKGAAANIVMEAMTEHARRQKPELEGLSLVARGVASAWSDMWAAIRGSVTRDSAGEASRGALLALQEAERRLEAQRSKGPNNAAQIQRAEDRVALLRTQVESLRLAARADGVVAARAASDAAANRAGIDEAAAAAAGKGSGGGGTIVNEFARQRDALRERLAMLGLNTEAEQLLAQISLGKFEKLAPAQREELLALAGQLDGRRAQIEALAQEERARERVAQFVQRQEVQAQAELQRLADGNQAIRQEIELLGATEFAKAAVEQARISSTIALKEEQLAIRANNGESDRALQSLRDEIALLRERADLVGTRQVVQAGLVAREAAERQAEDAGKANYEAVRDALSRAFQDTKNPVRAFAEGLGNAIYQRMTARMADALATQLVGSGGNGGMLGGFLSSLFGGGGGGGGFGFTELGFAKGGAFDSGGQVAERFAKGGTFTNQVIDRPTQFAYAGGRKLGVMGEAGPESVFPLARTRDGRLGVHAVGGSGQGVTPALNFKLEIINNGTPQREVGRQMNGDTMRVFVEDVVVANIREGGRVSTAMQSQYGVNRAFGVIV